MDALMSEILRHKGSTERLGSLLSTLEQAEKSNVLSPAAATELLAALDPVSQSLAYLFCLERIKLKERGGGGDPDFFDATSRFLTVCDHAQIRIVPEKFASVCHKFQQQALLLNRPRSAILPLRAAVAKLAPNGSYITPVHADLFLVCIKAKCYNGALPALSDEAYELNPTVTGMTAKDLLLYGYYGGMIHTARRKYAAALELFLLAITAPTYVASAIAVAAWKKYVVVSLIHNGTVQALPRYTSTPLHRTVKTEGAAYSDLQDAYSGSSAEWGKTVNKHRQLFIDDGNWGLVEIASRKRTMRAVQKLTQTYITLSLEGIAQAVELPSASHAEMLLLRMIENGDIFAQIDDTAGMVRFSEDPEDYSSTVMLAHLDKQLARSVDLAQRLQHVSNLVSCDKTYITKVQLREKQGAASFDDNMDTLGAAIDSHPMQDD